MRSSLFIFLLLLCSPTHAWAHRAPTPMARITPTRATPWQMRGGASATELPVSAPLTKLGTWYAVQIEKRPIYTKSVTACIIFALSDYLAQRLEGKNNQQIDVKRATAGALIGLLYFGPAAHFWYEAIFRLLPGTSLVSTLQKAVCGQLIFGPAFNCIFFAVGLLQAGNFTVPRWLRKIQQDLPGAWLAGAGFWPLVDLVSFSLVPKEYIPLFINLCSLVWTIYLSKVANKQ
ncbi:protein Mpv17 [Fistulifera solaris]|uniref:Protein Mpv17 n=1 Tax=Fistulifera solaris TaxID=1519565 RepID=A0A1Z5KT14_FISSO|nr:protein Mpv17 [Fistulifera solaris]|eukprot:GAX29235.1 protein Mpv17 [Fistulifera solaris]